MYFEANMKTRIVFKQVKYISILTETIISCKIFSYLSIRDSEKEYYHFCEYYWYMKWTKEVH